MDFEFIKPGGKLDQYATLLANKQTKENKMSELRALKDEFQIFQRKFEKFIEEQELNGPKAASKSRFEVESRQYTFRKDQESIAGWLCHNWDEPIILLPYNDSCFFCISEDDFYYEKLELYKKYDRKCGNFDEPSEITNRHNTCNIISFEDDFENVFYRFEPVVNDSYKMSRLKLIFEMEKFRMRSWIICFFGIKFCEHEYKIHESDNIVVGDSVCVYEWGSDKTQTKKFIKNKDISIYE